MDNPHYLWLAPLLAALKEGDKDLPLWDFNYSQLVKEVKSAGEAFNLLDLWPYGLRHTGASEDRARSTRSIEEIKKRGRWSSSKSVQRYEKGGRLAATHESYTAAFREHAALCDAALESVILGSQQPPPWRGESSRGKQS